MNVKKLKEIIPIALEYGLIKPTNFDNPCLYDSLNRLNYLLWILKEAGMYGLSTSEIQKKIELDLNTCKIYLRELIAIRLIRKERAGREEAIWYYLKK